MAHVSCNYFLHAKQLTLQNVVMVFIEFSMETDGMYTIFAIALLKYDQCHIKVHR